MTTTNTQFVSKEHYLAFRKEWSNAVNSEKAKRHTEVRTSTYGSTHMEITVNLDGWITGAHHVLYNILRNKPFHTGFTMTNKPSKIAGGQMPHLGLFQAVAQLKSIIKTTRQEEQYEPKKASFFSRKKDTDDSFWGTERIDEFLAPFGGTVTREMLLEIERPDVPALYNDYGPGRKVAAAITSGEATPRTYPELLALLEEVTK